jgi:hypothetical protein
MLHVVLGSIGGQLETFQHLVPADAATEAACVAQLVIFVGVRGIVIGTLYARSIDLALRDVSTGVVFTGSSFSWLLAT